MDGAAENGREAVNEEQAPIWQAPEVVYEEGDEREPEPGTGPGWSQEGTGERQEPTGVEQRKPANDREWGEWRRRTEARAEKLAAKRTARLDARITERFGHLENPRTGRPVRSAEELVEALENGAVLPDQNTAGEEGIPGGERTGGDRVYGHVERGDEAGQAPLADYLEEDAQGTRGQREQRLWEPGQSGSIAPQGMPGESAAAPLQMVALGERLMAGQMAEIQRLDGDVQSFEDLAKMPNFAEFDRLVKSGQDLVTAYKAVNFRKLAGKQTAAARRAALNGAAGRRHLAPLPAGAGTAGGKEIPADALAVWRAAFPDESAERLRMRYNAVVEGLK